MAKTLRRKQLGIFQVYAYFSLAMFVGLIAYLSISRYLIFHPSSYLF